MRIFVHISNIDLFRHSIVPCFRLLICQSYWSDQSECERKHSHPSWPFRYMCVCVSFDSIKMICRLQMFACKHILYEHADGLHAH